MKHLWKIGQYIWFLMDSCGLENWSPYKAGFCSFIFYPAMINYLLVYKCLKCKIQGQLVPARQQKKLLILCEPYVTNYQLDWEKAEDLAAGFYPERFLKYTTYTEALTYLHSHVYRADSSASMRVMICFVFGLCHKWSPLQVICLGGRPHFNAFAQQFPLLVCNVCCGCKTENDATL